MRRICRNQLSKDCFMYILSYIKDLSGFFYFKPLFLVIFRIQFCRTVFPESKSIKIMKFGSVIREIC